MSFDNKNKLKYDICNNLDKHKYFQKGTMIQDRCKECKQINYLIKELICPDCFQAFTEKIFLKNFQK